MPTQCAGEACDHRHDSESGALITYLTSSALTSINIYCEQPYTSPDGNRVASLRLQFCERKTSTGHLLEIMAQILQRIAVEAIRAGNTQRRTAIGQVVAWILRFGEELRPHIYPPRVATLDRLRRRARLRHKGD